ncbi:MAG TPA: radical SAM protein [Patescibacteria group bacterium]|nr:radical SAM protein [Patescibacteria group bacterium]
MEQKAGAYRNKNIKLKLLRTVGFWKEGGGLVEHLFFPPLAMGVLFSQLVRHGYDVTQDDLSMRVHFDHYDKAINARYNLGIFFQEERVRRYIASGVDTELESEIMKMLQDTRLDGVDIFLLSIPESLYNASNILFAVSLAKFLKKRYSPHIVVGGHPFSVKLILEQYAINGVIDYIVVEEGEEAVLDVLERILQATDGKKPDEFRIIEKPNKQILIPDFSGLPFDKYDLSFSLGYDYFSSHELVQDFFSSHTLLLPVQFVKGCPNVCAFCNSSGEGLRSFLGPEEVANGIQALQEKFNPTGFLFLNDTVNISGAYIKNVCAAIIKKGMRILWSDCATVKGLDEEAISKMREAGCIRLILGMETASPRLLAKVKKGIALAELERVLQLTAQYGIWTGIEVICGLPYETQDDVRLTVEFLLRNKQYIDRIYCNIFDLRPRSRMFLHPEEYGIENIRDINLYSSPNQEGVNKCHYVQFSFDETGGLKWEDKMRQQIDSYNAVVRATDSLACLPLFIEEHALFYLYSRSNDKETIKEQYRSLVNVFSGHGAHYEAGMGSKK